VTRKEIVELINIPPSSLSDWSKNDDENWRRKIYLLLKNITIEDAGKYINMGDIESMTLEEMDEKIHLYMEIEDKT